jgi:ABC-type dipeptide/oligopeptide/nickel transport system permease subunit
MYGSRVSLLVGIVSVGIGLLAGVTCGRTRYGTWLDWPTQD